MDILDLLFPKTCAGCGKVGFYLCPACLSNLRQAELVCPVCERPSIGGIVHPLCRRRFGLDGLWSLAVYGDPLKKIIHKYKYRLVPDLAKVLVDFLIEYWAKSPPQFLEEIKADWGQNWVIVPVPLHPRKQKAGALTNRP